MTMLGSVLSICVFAAALAYAVDFLVGNLTYFIRHSFTFRDPRLTWDPTTAMYTGRGPDAPNLDASDWAERNVG